MRKAHLFINLPFKHVYKEVSFKYILFLIFQKNGYKVRKAEQLISKIDLITKEKLSKFERLKRLLNVLFAKQKSVPSTSEDSGVIRLIAVKI